MKKILFLLFILLLPILFVKADNFDLSFNKVDDKYEVVIKEGDKVLNYDEANKKYSIGRYLSFYIDNRMHYFLDGKEISEGQYTRGSIIDGLRDKCDDKLYRCIDVTSQEDLLNKIDEIYSKRDIAEYYLIFDDGVFDKLNIQEINKIYTDKYVMPVTKNAYKYGEYGIMQPIRTVPFMDNYHMRISTLTIKITEEEERLVDKFLEHFLKEFEGLSDYEKILGVYSYIDKTTKYESDENGYTIFTEGRISPYDVLLEHKTVCIGSSTTFQFLMEKLGIESYIIDHVTISNPNSFSTSHTYNVVKLDGNWYIVDINAPSSGSSFLINGSNRYDKRDLSYLGITLANQSYYDSNPNAKREIDIDYDKYTKLADEIVKDGDRDKEAERQEKIDDITKGFNKEYIYIVGILLAIGVVIIYFVRRK